MAFTPDSSTPQFADLKGMLAQSKVTDNALGQMLQILLDRLEFLQSGHADVIQKINNSVNNITSIVTIVPNANATYLTTADESIPLAHSVQLLAGANITFDDTVPNKRIIAAVGGGGGTSGPPDPHHITHEPGGTDPMAVDAATNIGSLRTLGSGPNQAAPGNDTRFNPSTPHVPTPHAPTHSVGGTDPVDVKNLAGYPNNITEFLRADHTFAVPPGGGAGGGMDLDYLGNFVSGPVYNDGDIVLGPDGVLYMCTVDGTITPPEPWPGTGVAVNGTIDATYWVVSPHSQLTNERAMNALGTGYVRSTVGEPSVVPTIPLTDTTGTLPDNRLTSNVALKNIDNLFSAVQTLPSYSRITGPNSAFYFNDTAAPVNAKTWRMISYSNGNLYVEALDDAGTGIQAQFAFGRDNQLYGQGAGLTNLNASYLAAGTVPIGRLGTNAPAANTFLRGDNTWAPVDAFPSGLIVISLAPCPVGWTRIAWDGYFLRGAYPGTIGTAGGAATHAHGPGSLYAVDHNHGGVVSGNTSAVGDHAHNFGVHAYFDSGDNDAGQLNVDGGGSGNMARSPHRHRTQVDYDGVVAGSGNHSHTFSGGIPGSGNLAIGGGTDYASSLPPYVDIYYCQKN